MPAAAFKASPAGISRPEGWSAGNGGTIVSSHSDVTLAAVSGDVGGLGRIQRRPDPRLLRRRRRMRQPRRRPGGRQRTAQHRNHRQLLCDGRGSERRRAGWREYEHDPGLLRDRQRHRRLRRRSCRGQCGHGSWRASPPARRRRRRRAPTPPLPAALSRCFTRARFRDFLCHGSGQRHGAGCLCGAD